ncbi:hypothetical protein ACFL6H_02105 [Candidatus Latescibacterota bacterium]
MKKTSLLLLLFFVSVATYADTTVNIQNDFGYTIVEVTEAMDSPEYTAANRRGLVDWDNFNYKALIQVLTDKTETVSWGPEIGVSRLYYWEEKYDPFGDFSPQWTWGTIWTGHIGGIVRKSLPYNYYLMTGASIYYFFNGSGTTVGIPFAFGHELPISDTITVPVEFRMDVIFGNAVPIGVGGGIGIKLKL